MGDLTDAPIIGILVGMQSERDALGPIQNDPRIAFGISGARPDQAEREAARLAGLGCRVLVSLGVAGGLDPTLVPGRLLIGSEVVEEDGTITTLVPPDLPGGRRARLLGLDRPAMTAEEKAALFAVTRAAAVDMETHRVARVARMAGLEAVAIRAVGDPATRALPRLAADALGPDGRPRIGRVIAGLLGEPWALPRLLRLRSDTEAALASLSGIAARLPEALIEAAAPRETR